MAQIKISIINASTVVGDQEAQAAVGPLQKQVSQHFAPAWGVDADLDFVGTGKQPPMDHWWLVVLDYSDMSGALGYHDMTPAGLPLGKIFAGTDKQYGSSWTVTASHELLEMLGDPDINLTAMSMTDFQVDQNVVGRLYAYEVCDACEADKFGYKINGTVVSDFVYPSWFESFRKKGAQFDYGKRITAPFQLLSGGYIGVFDVTAGSGWQQVTAQSALMYSARPRVGSRRERRRTPREEWLVSDVRKRTTARAA